MLSAAGATGALAAAGGGARGNRDGSIDRSRIEFNGMFFEEFSCGDCQGKHYVTPDGVIHFSWGGGVTATGTFESNCNVIHLSDPQGHAPTSWSRL